MPVIARPGQPLRCDSPPLAPGAGLQDVEQREPHRLLYPLVALDLDIRACPETAQIGAVFGDHPFPARVNGDGQCGRDLIGDRWLRANRGPAVGDELDQPQPLTGLERRGDRDTTQIAEALTRHPHRRWRVEVMLHRRSEPQTADRGAVQQRGATSTAGVGL